MTELDTDWEPSITCRCGWRATGTGIEHHDEHRHIPPILAGLFNIWTAAIVLILATAAVRIWGH